MPVLQGISNYEGTSYKKLQDIASSFFYFLLFDINFYIRRRYYFYNFSELDSKLSKGFTKFQVPNAHNPLRLMKVSSQCFLD